MGESFEGMLKTKEIGIHVRESESGFDSGRTVSNLGF